MFSENMLENAQKLQRNSSENALKVSSEYCARQSQIQISANVTGVLRGPQDQPDRRGLVADLAVCAGGEGGDRPFQGEIDILLGASYT